MSKPKLQKFAEYEAFPNTFNAESQTKGLWQQIFQNNNSITLELACGKGDYTIGLAQLNPNQNFIGIDIKGDRLYTGAKIAIDQNLSNVRFLRISIDNIAEYFAPQEISEIWIIFADPQPQKERKRLSSYKFLNLYRQIAPATAKVHVKTDSDLFYESTLEQVKRDGLTLEESIPNIYALNPISEAFNPISEAFNPVSEVLNPISEVLNPISEVLKIQTYYEKMWLDMGRTIKYCRFILGDIVSQVPPKKSKLSIS